MVMIVQFFLLLVCVAVPSMCAAAQERSYKVIMIDPAGHAKQTGHRLVQSYERAEMFQCAEAMKRSLESRFNVRVILTRGPGEEIIPLQNASFANRLEVDFFLRLHCFHHEQERPRLWLYHLIFDPMMDRAQRKHDQLSFTPVFQAHFYKSNESFGLGKDMMSYFSGSAGQKSCDIAGLYGVPLKPLIGIVAPALVVEIGLSADDQWRGLVDLLAESIASALHIPSL